MRYLQKFNENKLWYKTIKEFLDYIDGLKNNTFVFIDTETTGLGGPKKQQLTQIAAVAIDPNNYAIIDEFNEKIILNQDMKDILDEPITTGGWSRRKVLDFNHYDDYHGKEYIDEQDSLEQFFQWVDALNDPLFVIQNAEFDMNMFGGRSGRKLKYPVLDTKQLLQLYIIPLYQKLAETDDTYKEKIDTIGTSARDNGLISSSMSKWVPEFEIPTEGYHDALYDCKMTIEMYKNMITLLKDNKDLDIMKYQTERIKTIR